MELNKQRWYVRLFFWSLGIWDDFLDRYTAEKAERDGTNLCFFMRVIFVYAPLVLALHLLVYGAAIAALTAMPIYFFGGIGYLWGMGTIVTLGSIVTGIMFLKLHLKKRARRSAVNASQPLAEREAPAAPKQAPAGPSFRTVLWNWFLAQKKKICPMITFTDQQGEVQS